MSPRTILLIGASRGIGHAMAAEFLAKNWNVIGTVRGGKRTPLHDLYDQNPGRVEIKDLDICEPGQIARLRTDMFGRAIDMLFVNAGTTNQDQTQRIGEVTTDEFVHVMVTNALSPMRVVESLAHLVQPAGLVGVMSSGLGSITNNVTGRREVYRGSKAALNMYMRCFAASLRGSSTALVVIAPGWIKTKLGGPEAPYTLEEKIPSLVNVLLEKQARPGLEFLDAEGNTVPW